MIILLDCSCIKKEGWVVVPILVAEWSNVIDTCEKKGNEVQCLVDLVDGMTAEAVREFEERRGSGQATTFV